jgi:hypothetical protein
MKILQNLKHTIANKGSMEEQWRFIQIKDERTCHGESFLLTTNHEPLYARIFSFHTRTFKCPYIFFVLIRMQVGWI